MKTNSVYSIRRLAQASFMCAVLLIMGESAMAASAAGTAANATLQNTVTVTWDDLGGTPAGTASSTVQITVNLIATAPLIEFRDSDGADLALASEGQAINLRYWVTTQANGYDDYDLSDPSGSSDTAVNGGFSSTAALTDPSTFELGATSVGADFSFGVDVGTITAGLCLRSGSSGTNTGVCALEVPNDELGADSDVNGLANGDLVLIRNSGAGFAEVFCDITTVVDTNATNPYVPGVTFSTINVRNCSISRDGTGFLASTTFEIGSDVFETQSQTIAVVTGDLNGAGPDDHVILANATDGVNNTDVSGPATITVYAAALEIVKYVRQVDDSQSPTTVPNNQDARDILTLDGVTYYHEGITADPGDALEYAILIINVGGPLTDVRATDPAVPFTTYESTTGVLILTDGLVLHSVASIVDPACTAANTCVVSSDVAATSNLDDGILTGGDFGGVDGGGIITVFAGIGGDENPAAGGAIAASKVSVITYRLTVNN